MEVDGRYSDDDKKINVAYYTIGETALKIMEDVDGTGVVAKGLNRYFAFLHSKQCHGVLSEVIDGKCFPLNITI